MTNTEKLYKIWEEAEKNHLNLYHDINKKEVENYVKSLDNLDNLNETEFYGELMKFFALFKDAHTKLTIPYQSTNKRILYKFGKFFVLDGQNWKEIKQFGEIPSKQLPQFLKKYICYETKEWLRQSTSNLLNNACFCEIVGLFKNKQAILTTTDGEKILLIQGERENKPSSPQKSYDYKILDDNILYIKYFSCSNDKDLDFKHFVKILKFEIEKNGIKDYILDLRNNTGGDSSIIKPLEKLVEQKKLNGVVLINNGVFSSGRFAVADFKKQFNTPLVGEPTGGAAKSYGYIKPLKVEYIKFSVSKKLWDFSEIFGYDGAIQPDVFIEKPLSDFQNETDIQLETAVHICEKQRNQKLAKTIACEKCL